MGLENKLQEQLRRAEDQQKRFIKLAAPVFMYTMATGLLFICLLIYMANNGGTLPASLIPVGVLILVIGMSGSVLYWAFVVLDSQSKVVLRQQREYFTEAISRLQVLAEQHPELLLQDELRALVAGDVSQREGRRSFWITLAVNLLFTLLGFALSYAATKLGWLR